MRDHTVAVDRSGSPSKLELAPVFNVAVPFVDRHVTEGRGETIAIRWATGESSYADLAAGVNRTGNVLLGLGLGRGDRVLMVVKDCPAFFHLFWGAIKAGLVPVPVNVLLKGVGLSFLIEDSGCACVSYSPEFAAEVEAALEAAGGRVRRLPTEGEGDSLATRLMTAQEALDPALASPDDTAFWLYSSGTTGRPKGVLHRHRDPVVTSELYAIGVLECGPGDVFFSAAKLFFAYGLGNAMTFPLWVGGTAVLDERPPSAASTFETIERFRPTVYFGVPTLYAAQLHALEAGARDLSSLRLCVSAGEALPADLFLRWKDATGLQILDGIGSTEALHIFISNRPGGVRPGTSGVVVPGYEARVVDEEGREAAPGTAGQLEIRGDSVTPGYWNRPERTAETLSGGWLRTGDTYIRGPAGYYRYQGRADDMIKVGGIWCSPFDIEACLIEHPAVLEAAVVGRADEHDLVKPEAFVVLRDGHVGEDGLADELVRHCREGLPKYMYPRWVHFVGDLPKTATGKIQRFRLRERSLAAGPVSEGE